MDQDADFVLEQNLFGGFFGKIDSGSVLQTAISPASEANVTSTAETSTSAPL
jgi:hypothetical protein